MTTKANQWTRLRRHFESRRLEIDRVVSEVSAALTERPLNGPAILDYEIGLTYWLANQYVKAWCNLYDSEGNPRTSEFYKSVLSEIVGPLAETRRASLYKYPKSSRALPADAGPYDFDSRYEMRMEIFRRRWEWNLKPMMAQTAAAGKATRTNAADLVYPSVEEDGDPLLVESFKRAFVKTERSAFASAQESVPQTHRGNTPVPSGDAREPQPSGDGQSLATEQKAALPGAGKESTQRSSKTKHAPKLGRPGADPSFRKTAGCLLLASWAEAGKDRLSRVQWISFAARLDQQGIKLTTKTLNAKTVEALKKKHPPIESWTELLRRGTYRERRSFQRRVYDYAKQARRDGRCPEMFSDNKIIEEKNRPETL